MFYFIQLLFILTVQTPKYSVHPNIRPRLAMCSFLWTQSHKCQVLHDTALTPSFYQLWLLFKCKHLIMKICYDNFNLNDTIWNWKMFIYLLLMISHSPWAVSLFGNHWPNQFIDSSMRCYNVLEWISNFALVNPSIHFMVPLWVKVIFNKIIVIWIIIIKYCEVLKNMTE